jgi:C_GCAxxG_C_C family probable redox protein
LFRDEPPSDELIAAMAPFGGGMGSSGQICGTLSGALAVIGYTLGKTEAKGKDHRLMWKISHKMVTQFAEICQPYGGTNCANIARINWKNHAAVLNFYKNPQSTRKNCVYVIRETSNFLYDLITEHFPKKD